MADKFGEWIDLEERWPQEGVNVLIRLPNEQLMVALWRQALFPRWYGDRTLPIFGVTHWMPLYQPEQKLIAENKYREWISCDEQLPEVGIGVFVWGKTSTYGSAIACIAARHLSSMGGGWYFTIFGNETVVFVTHWMPLPKPPGVKWISSYWPPKTLNEDDVRRIVKEMLMEAMNDLSTD